ncbi:MAG: hypothetical protein LWX55_00335 [Deltaproteobacteria bacterium]|jgi:hypothetical protein|nr:hypothetical protein [Deltaproteobacteria bacterium]MDL1976998.1 hypothetical protein [Deltaproteobacteria bacterium]
MAKVFRPSSREEKIISKIEGSKERELQQTIHEIRNAGESLSRSLSMKLIENGLVETTSKEEVEKQIALCLDSLARSDDFDIDYQIAPFRQIVQRPNKASLYIMAFVLEKLINHKSIVDIYGADEDIYLCINKEILKCIKD